MSDARRTETVRDQRDADLAEAVQLLIDAPLAISMRLPVEERRAWNEKRCALIDRYSAKRPTVE